MMKLRESKLILYQLAVLALYLLYVSRTRVLRIGLPVYMIAAVFPFLFPTLKIPKKFDAFSGIYIFVTTCYLIYGVVFQNTFETITTYVSRILQFILLVILINKEEIEPPKKCFGIIKVAVLLESIVDILLALLLWNGHQVRLVAGAQPIAGNIGIVILPLILYGYYKEQEKRNKIILSYIILFFWTCLSGTRGYILIFAVCGIVPAIDYIREAKNDRIKLINRTILTVFIFGISIVLFFNSNVYDRVLSTLRINSGVGIRDYENQVAKRFFLRTELVYKVFGIGYGGKAANVPGYFEAYNTIMSQWGSWGASHYLTPSGSLFHNYYYNILLVSGLCGVLLTGSIFVWGFKKIKKNIFNTRLLYCLILYWSGFFVMLYFRWSCSCGIGEMIIFTEVLRMSKYDLMKTNSV